MAILESVFVQYFEEYKNIRSDNMDVGNVEFHKKNELKIKTPEQWAIRDDLIDAIVSFSFKSNSSIPNVYVVYSDTSCYVDFYEKIKQRKISGDLKYGSYFELFYAISSSSQDIRMQQRMKSDIEAASIVVVLDSSKCPDIVLNAVRQFTNGCLVIIE